MEEFLQVQGDLDITHDASSEGEGRRVLGLKGGDFVCNGGVMVRHHKLPTINFI